MLSFIIDLIKSLRKSKTPVMSKWEGYEQIAYTLVVIGLALQLYMTIIGSFNGLLTLFGIVIGILIVFSYLLMALEKQTLGFFIALIIVTASAATVGIFNSYPLWALFFNSFSASVCIVGLAAIWTRGIQ